MEKAEKLTDRDARLLDDLRKAFAGTTVSLPNGALFNGSDLASQAGLEKAISKVVLQRSRMVKP